MEGDRDYREGTTGRAGAGGERVVSRGCGGTRREGARRERDGGQFGVGETD